MNKSIAKTILFVACVLVLFISCNGEFVIDKVGFTVNFYSNGKEVSPSQTVLYGQTLKEPEIPEKPADDMYFVGWFDGDTQWEFENGVAEDMNLVAKFDLIALKFESKSSFKITPQFADGVSISYSLDNGTTWTNCKNNVEIAVSQEIYFRGSGNTVITGDIFSNKSWKIISDNGKDGIRCSGNIEALLDWETVVAGNHPSMGDCCFFGLFYECAHLVTAPELPATELTPYCYAYMFSKCSNLRTVPILPRVDEYASFCYAGMFADCPQLKFVTWKTNSQPFFVSGDNVASAAMYMLNAETPEDNTAYYYFVY